MKRLYAYLPLLVLPVVFVLISSSSGSPGGYSGSTGDSGLNCTGCHIGTAQNVSGWITSNIPSIGYAGGQTYTITVNGSHASSSKFGFELTAEDLLGNKVGTFIITNTQQTKLVNQNKSVTHTSQGTAGSGGSKSWSVNWTAPAGSTGQIRFNAAVNATNSNGGTGGDVVYLTNVIVNPDVTGVEELAQNFAIYPNPSIGVVNFDASKADQSQQVNVYNTNGQVVYNFTLVNSLNTLDLTHLPKGVYFVKSSADQFAGATKLVIR